MKPVLIQHMVKKKRRERITPDPVGEDLHKESDRLFAFIMAVLAVIVLGSIIAVAEGVETQLNNQCTIDQS